jgi:hypothetical protein
MHLLDEGQEKPVVRRDGMALKNVNKPTLQARCKTARSGVTKYFGSAASVALRGKAWKPTDIDTALAAAIADGDATDAAKAAWRSAVTQGKASRAIAVALLAALKALVLATYGSDPKVFADFGFEVPKAHGKVPAAEKAAAVQKTKATKKLLGPTGKKQRKQATKAAAETPATTTPATTATSPAPKQ